MPRNRNLSLDPKDTVHPHLSGWFLLLILAAMLAVLLRPAPAHGDWPAGGRGYIGGSSGGGLVPDASGNVLTRTSAIDTSGVTQWTVNPGGTLYRIAPISGGMILAHSGAGTLLLATRINATGSFQWSGVQVANNFGTPSPSSFAPLVATDAGGNSFFCWRGSAGISVGKVSPTGTPQWPASGVLVNNAANLQQLSNISLVPDEAGGCYVVWEDWRVSLSVSDVYMQHVLTAGSVAWAANGQALASGSPHQGRVSACSDGAGGVIVAWRDNRDGDNDVYAQRVDGNGNSLWTAGGLPLFPDPVGNIQDQVDPSLIADGSGGAFVAWSDFRNGPSQGFDLYAQRLDGSGAFQWGPDGVSVIATTNWETSARIVGDGAVGVFVGCASAGPVIQHLTGAGAALWTPNGIRPGVWAIGTPDDMAPDGVGGCYFGSGTLMRILPSGIPAWGHEYQVNPTVSDVPADEGGWANLTFNKALPDGNSAYGSYTVTAYSVWRKRPGSASAARTARLEDPSGVLGVSSVPSVSNYLTGYTDFPPGTWDAVAYLPRLPGASSYSFLVPTHADSTSSGPANDDFAVISISTTDVFVVSLAAAGHSVDNLAPGAPQNLVGGRTVEGYARLQWSPTGASDLWHYSVYRGNSPSFVPSASNRIGQPTGTSFEDAEFEPGISHYKVSTTDRHENESEFSLLTPSQIVSVPPGINPGRTYISSAIPNPFDALTALEFGIARRSTVVIEIYDMTGRRVRNLVHETRDPGVYRAVWDGRDDARHPLAGGVYLARFEADGQRKSLKIVHTQ